MPIMFRKGAVLDAVMLFAFECYLFMLGMDQIGKFWLVNFGNARALCLSEYTKNFGKQVS